ncbi:diguanylate cyclase [candidate division GN15 bacterium]|uniref:Diguanylate cyclase n=1 Tax=candidate division GN15 bacterium TaxID=2072418 RepID=A0A855WZ52_9BACT|nr:MAG: diguanylate cyclase [candidate division GN15 bacterium]
MDAKRIQLVEQIRTAISRETERARVLEIAIRLIDSYSDDFNWTGFYMVEGDVLKVGPYIGPVTEHTVIPLGRGICGAAATRKTTVVVDDVLADPRFLACSIHTRSEIVVPLMDGERCIGEIDIDSNRIANFTAEDREMLEAIAQVVVEKLRQI